MQRPSRLEPSVMDSESIDTCIKVGNTTVSNCIHACCSAALRRLPTTMTYSLSSPISILEASWLQPVGTSWLAPIQAKLTQCLARSVRSAGWHTQLACTATVACQSSLNTYWEPSNPMPRLQQSHAGDCSTTKRHSCAPSLNQMTPRPPTPPTYTHTAHCTLHTCSAPFTSASSSCWPGHPHAQR